MPNLSDIPEELLDVNKQAEFLQWLGDQPIEINHRRELASVWAVANNTAFSPGELDHALREIDLPDGIEE
jgi:hypothetical protein